MKNSVMRKFTVGFLVMLFSSAVLNGCGKSEADNTLSVSEDNTTADASGSQNDILDEYETQQESSGVPAELEVRFGDDGQVFMMHLETNETAAAIANYVGSSDWRLPIYEDEEDADYDVLQYYDIPSRYDIPSNPETVTSVLAGEVYYSDPNRIVLFYHDAEITGEYTKIGTFDATEEFVSAVEENPVLEGWGNKIVHITQP